MHRHSWDFSGKAERGTIRVCKDCQAVQIMFKGRWCDSISASRPLRSDSYNKFTAEQYKH